MMKKIIDTSYFSAMLSYYPMDDERFNFVWESLANKIKSKEIILLDVVYKELQKIKNKEVNEFLKNFVDDLESTDQNDYVKIVSLYENNKNKFQGSFERTFGITEHKKTNADPYLIAKAMEIENSVILTDEIMPQSPNKKGKKKLNIPSLAKEAEIESYTLRKNIKLIIDF